MEQIVRLHLEAADTIRLALHEDEIVGFSVASRYKMKTPFYPHPVNTVYQRMLYLHPEFLYRGLGIRLLLATMKDLFGWFWPFKRLVAICRTQNPVVARFMDLYNIVYPRHKQPVPDNIRQFAESLVPLLQAKYLDQQFRLVGTLSDFKGVDQTDTWNRYYHHRANDYEKLMLSSVFEERQGRIINSGSFLLMIGYARPLNFIRFLFH
ncbi:MAG: hypothetical protein P8Z78_14420 [Gammaproteobacteria bacterium]